MAMRSVAGTVDTTAKTRKPRAINSDGTFLSIEDKYCCLGLASVSLALLDSFQRIPYGTLAWKQSYSRRNIIGKSNSMLKDKGGLNAGWYRAFGLAAHTIGALALAVAHNLKELKRILSRKSATAPPPSLRTTEHTPPQPLRKAFPPPCQPEGRLNQHSSPSAAPTERKPTSLKSQTPGWRISMIDSGDFR